MKTGKVIRRLGIALAAVPVILLIVLQAVLQPKVLTRIVNRAAAQYVEGEVSFREIRAYVIRSFPYLEIKASDFSITYPHERYAAYDSLYPDSARRFSLLKAGWGSTEKADARRDTLLSFRNLDVSVNYMSLLGGKWHLHRALLERPRIFAHYYDSTAANWDIFPLGSAEEDLPDTATVQATKPLPRIVVNHLALTDRPMLIFTNPQDTLYGLFTMKQVALEGKLDSAYPDQLASTLGIDSLFLSGRLPRDTVALGVDHLTLDARERGFDLDAAAALWLATGDYGRLRVPIGLQAKGRLPRRADHALELDLAHLGLQLARLELTARATAIRQPEGWGLDAEAAIDDCPLGAIMKEYEQNIPSLKKIRTNARVNLIATAKGTYGSGRYPQVDALLEVAPSDIDYEGLDRTAHVALEASVSTADFKSVDARIERFLLDMLGARIEAAATLRDVLGKDPAIGLDARLLARVDSLTQAFTQEQGVSGTGSVEARLHAKTRLSQLNMERIGKASINCELSGRDLRLKDADGMRLHTPLLQLSLGNACNTLSFQAAMDTLRMKTGTDFYALRGLKLDVAAAPHQRRPRSGASRRRPRRDSLAVKDDFASADLSFSLSNSVKQYLRNWDVDGMLELERGRVFMPAFPLRTSVSKVQGRFVNDSLLLRNITLQAGKSDLSAKATLSGLRRMMLGRRGSKLKLKADVSSHNIDANELLRAYAYYSAYQPPRSLQEASALEVEQEVARAQLPDSSGSSLIVLPANLEMELGLEAGGIKYDSLQISWASSDIAMRQRTLQITNTVAMSNMGDIYFEGFYATRAKDDIKAGFDLNLVDITAEKVITLFPAVDTIMPMLNSFAGLLDCELAATSDLDTCMNLVRPSIDGVMKISGKNLSLKESKEFTKLARLLMFRNKKQAKIDQMSVTGIVRDNRLEVFPFVLEVDRYMLAASGTQHLDQPFSYHLSVIKSPLLVKFGINAWGSDFDHIRYGLGRARYRNERVPIYTKQLDQAQVNLLHSIHHIFDLGVEKAMAENRADTKLPYVPDEIPADSAASTDLESADIGGGAAGALGQELTAQVSARRDALKASILSLQSTSAK